MPTQEASLDRPAAAPAPTASPPPLAFFLHIPKTAGTSFLLTLENIFGSRRLRRLDDSDPHLGETIAGLAAGDPGADCLAGHVPLSMLAPFGGRLRLFTLLRHPLARVFSLHRFLRPAPAHTLAEMALHPGFTFDDFIASEAPALWAQTRNGMCRMLSGDPAFTDPEHPDFAAPAAEGRMLEGAWRNLQAMDFGIVERMIDSLVLLQSAWSLPVRPEENVKNTTGQDAAEQDLGAVARVVAANGADIALYEMARALFAQRVGATAQHGDKAGTGLFAPDPGRTYDIADIPGRQGFHEIEETGFAWLRSDRPARIHLRGREGAVRFVLRLYSVFPDYSIERMGIRLNGLPVAHETKSDDSGWHTVTTAPVRLRPGGNALSLDPSHFVSLRLIDPDTKDERYLSVALHDLTMTA